MLGSGMNATAYVHRNGSHVRLLLVLTASSSLHFFEKRVHSFSSLAAPIRTHTDCTIPTLVVPLGFQRLYDLVSIWNHSFIIVQLEYLAI
jgi:hypothetical protein